METMEDPEESDPHECSHVHPNWSTCWLAMEMERLLVAAGFSIAIELLQLVTTRGLMEFDDVLHNMIGAVVGAGIVMVVGKKLK